MQIKKAILSLGVTYLCCATSMNGNPIHVKYTGKKNFEEINVKEWEKVSSSKKLDPKYFKPFIHKDLEKFLVGLLPALKTQAEKPNKERRVRSLTHRNF